MITVKFDWKKGLETGKHTVTAPTYADCLEIGFDELTVERKEILSYQTVGEEEMTKNKEFQNRVINNLEEKVKHYETLARYTKKSVKLKHHKDNIKFLNETIAEAKAEYGI